MTEQNIDERKINQLIGEPIVLNWKSPKPLGSPGLFIKSFKSKTGNAENILLDSKCNFEKRPDGLLLHSSLSNKQTLIPIPEENILDITITRGKEEVSPIPFYPMWMLMKLGVSVLKARYFGLRKNQYSIEEMELKVRTSNYEMNFVANGYLFERHLAFLKGLGYGSKLKIEMQ